MEINIEKYFSKEAEAKKDVVIFSHRHWMAYAGILIMSVIVIFVPLAILLLVKIYQPQILTGILLYFLVIFLSAYYLLTLTFIFSSWISFYYDVYIVTTETIVDVIQQGFFNREVSQLSLLRIQDVSSHVKGIFQTVFNYGDVLIQTAGEKQVFLLKAVPNPQAFSDKVLELHNKLIEEENCRHEAAQGEGSYYISRPKEESSNENIISANLPEPHLQQGELKKEDLDQGGEIKL